MITQSFLYNAIFFTYALVLTKIYDVPATDTAYYFIFFALGNLIGPLTLGHLFDTIGRRRMIAGTYLLSGTLLAISAFLFNAGALNAVTQTALLVRHLLLRLGRSQRRLSDRQRDLPGRGPGQGHRRLLRHRPDLRCDRAVALRTADRERTGPLQAVHRLPDRSGRHGIGGVVEILLGVAAEGKSLEDVASPLSFGAGALPAPVQRDRCPPGPGRPGHWLLISDEYRAAVHPPLTAPRWVPSRHGQTDEGSFVSRR